ncbi:MAG TPA: 16S rRNA (adenine(1518)-N(6)/adenine(1519)-N(6))-dimethyltransferase RsmA [Parvularculaceae bacterium]|nr:16S rRNA (adenine(1518)-N(6)/adenine(1519)-N(6))-dimethyltransferase RsmA [Amphiplicatus sp.]HOP18840.1 16S rRNA (adenine(1518)-N(6)/adenine(1519)-N(6))-dimethyltransferase RsmA [Amphiplicatus sp.]HPE30661.1 16S rRNA (adenine(1518)-N(6)/adenine(1519)-N(6))-dimethyltransferase RsmA [Parvularculaceae bacterium]HRX37883.1 16S rRNA (adenine(1518)-N(6)/adenine(1519)-N(6))-dimethyltransferase RsmA [Parvularculaceae bacterium]
MNDGLDPLRDVIARYDLGAKKSLGQHFLLDLNLTRKIARAASVSADDRVLEIGPGPGGLTRALLEAGSKVVAIERDARCIAALEEVSNAYPGKLNVIEADALEIDERALLGPGIVKICANLPYNISTELLIKWLRANHEHAAPLWSVMALMFQKEVADRILAAPGSKTYGRLSVISQAASRPRRAFDLPARAFTPPPKVDSTVVVFEPANTTLPNIAALERVTQAAFSQRRKMLRSSLKSLFGPETEARLEGVGIAPTTRAEDVSVSDFLALAQG